MALVGIGLPESVDIARPPRHVREALFGVWLVKTTHGQVISAYTTEAAANARRDRFNADPWIEPGAPDTDAPYSVEGIMVQGEVSS